MAVLETVCPYCGTVMKVMHGDDYAPVYYICVSCGEKFIAEPLAERVASYRLGEAPGWSDPESREVDGSGYDEQ